MLGAPEKSDPETPPGPRAHPHGGCLLHGLHEGRTAVAAGGRGHITSAGGGGAGTGSQDEQLPGIPAGLSGPFERQQSLHQVLHPGITNGMTGQRL